MGWKCHKNCNMTSHFGSCSNLCNSKMQYSWYSCILSVSFLTRWWPEQSRYSPWASYQLDGDCMEYRLMKPCWVNSTTICRESIGFQIQTFHVCQPVDIQKLDGWFSDISYISCLLQFGLWLSKFASVQLIKEQILL